MKKILATLVTLALLLALPCALAEQIPAINWEDVEAQAADIQASWYTFDSVAVEVWIPDIFENKEITAEDGEDLIGKFEVADGSAGIYVQYIQGEAGLSMEDTIANLEANGALEIERCTLNGLDAVSFKVADVDAVYVGFVTDSGNHVQFIFTPISDEGFAAVAQLVTASIRPETEG